MAHGRAQVRRGVKERYARRKTKLDASLAAGAYAECPYYAPQYCRKRTPMENLQWRITLLEAAAGDKGLQRDLRQACFEDVLFFCNFACFVYEPRGLVKIRPFATWSHQDPALITMDRAITDSEAREEPLDIVIDKSRGQGATWMYLMVLLRRWLRDDLFSAGLVTRNEKLVDSTRDPDTLLWKFCWALKMLPSWLQPEGFDWQKHRNLSEHSIVNPTNGANIVGYSATGDVARGGRKTVFALDEFATFNPGEDYAALNSTSHVTNCRFLVSTFKGDSGAYYEAATEDNNAVKIVLDWRDNPTQNRQLYRVVMGRIAEAYPERDGRLMPRDLEVIRYQHQQLKRRGFVVENRLRNVWYNQQCLRPGSTPRGIAQELDRDPRGAESKVFNGEIVKQAIAECARPPLLQGRLVVDMEQAEVRAPQVVAQEDGEFQLWTPIGLNGQVPVGLYVVGVDVSAGTGNDFSSNSAAVVVNRLTGEQVAQWTSNTYPQQRFAHVVVALARWFHEALVIPEANFASAFMTTMLETIGYQKVWRRNTEVVGFKKLTQKYGFWMKDDDLKLKLFEVLQAAIAQRAFVPRSREMLQELNEYSWKNGKIIHVGSTKTDDEGSKGRAHGDRVIAACLAWHVCAEDPHLAERAEQEVIMVPPGSMAARLKEFDELYLSVGSDPWQEGGLDIFTPAAVAYGDDWG